MHANVVVKRAVRAVFEDQYKIVAVTEVRVEVDDIRMVEPEKRLNFAIKGLPCSINVFSHDRDFCDEIALELERTHLPDA